MPQQALHRHEEVTRNLKVIRPDQDPEEIELGNDEFKFFDEDVADELALIRREGQEAAAKFNTRLEGVSRSVRTVTVEVEGVKKDAATVRDYVRGLSRRVNETTTVLNDNSQKLWERISDVRDELMFDLGIERDTNLAMDARIRALTEHARAQAQQPLAQEPAWEKLLLYFATAGTVLCVLGLAIKFLF
jgi:archaellum component FlaC